MIAIKNNIKIKTNVTRLNTNIKTFLSKKTPIIKIVNIERDKNTSGINIFQSTQSFLVRS